MYHVVQKKPRKFYRRINVAISDLPTPAVPRAITQNAIEARSEHSEPRCTVPYGLRRRSLVAPHLQRAPRRRARRAHLVREQPWTGTTTFTARTAVWADESLGEI